MTIGQLACIVEGNFPGGPWVIEVRTHAVGDMYIRPTSMMNNGELGNDPLIGGSQQPGASCQCHANCD
jgi:hypothetical protein